MKGCLTRALEQIVELLEYFSLQLRIDTTKMKSTE